MGDFNLEENQVGDKREFPVASLNFSVNPNDSKNFKLLEVLKPKKQGKGLVENFTIMHHIGYAFRSQTTKNIKSKNIKGKKSFYI